MASGPFGYPCRAQVPQAAPAVPSAAPAASLCVRSREPSGGPAVCLRARTKKAGHTGSAWPAIQPAEALRLPAVSCGVLRWASGVLRPLSG